MAATRFHPFFHPTPNSVSGAAHTRTGDVEAAELLDGFAAGGWV